MGSGALKMWDDNPYLPQQLPVAASMHLLLALGYFLSSSLLKFNLESCAHP